MGWQNAIQRAILLSAGVVAFALATRWWHANALFGFTLLLGVIVLLAAGLTLYERREARRDAREAREISEARAQAGAPAPPGPLPPVSAWADLPPEAFRRAVADAFRAAGWAVDARGDGPVTFLAWKRAGDRPLVVHARATREPLTGAQLKHVLDKMPDVGEGERAVVSLGGFDADAQLHARIVNVHMLDAAALRALAASETTPHGDARQG